MGRESWILCCFSRWYVPVVGTYQDLYFMTTLKIKLLIKDGKHEQSDVDSL